jgi:hypothetical protein
MPLPNPKAAIEAVGDENFGKGFSHVRIGEKGIIFTAKKNYAFSA